MIYSPTDRLELHFVNVDALIEELRSPLRFDERLFELLDFLVPLHHKLTEAQQKRLREQMKAMKWDVDYIYGRPHTLTDSPGAYADWIMCYGYWPARTMRDAECRK